MKNRISAVFLVVALSLTIFAACRGSEAGVAASGGDVRSETSSQSRTESKPEIMTLKFNDDFDYNAYVGQKVKIRGYMSTLSPVDGKFIYLMNVPYQICPFCLPNTATIVNTIAVYASPGKSFDFYDGAIEVIGTISNEETVDEFGYFYPYKITDASYTKVDTSQLSENLKIYGALTQDGILSDIMALGTRVDYNAFFACVDREQGVETEFDIVDNSEFDDIIKRINAISKTDYTALISVLEELRAFNNIVNSNIEAQDYAMNTTAEMDAEYLVIVEKLYEWLNKYEI